MQTLKVTMEQQSLKLKYSENLFEEILSEDQLRIAYKAVRSNQGSPGIDKISVEQYGENLEENLRELIEEVTNWNYRPLPVKRVRIPKPGNDKERLLGIPSVKDRVLQYSLKMSLEKIFEERFSDNSYGFRPAIPHRSQRTGMEQKLVQANGSENNQSGNETTLETTHCMGEAMLV